MRKKVELLAPAGSFEALQAAVQNGCDAVYLGGSMFGARAFAHNFDEEQMKEAVAYAHLYGVYVYVTVNTLIYDDEMEQALAYIKTLQDADVDALIIQDLGLFTRVKERFPEFELHASTQMHIHNPQGILMLRDMGAKRVVVPRETPIEQIAEYTKLGVDLEVFVQGALCVSYSGQCLMSSLTLNRSGNRGECAQSCRMQYTLEEDHHGVHKEIKTKGKYLLSPKDLNTLEEVPSLIEAGIASFKIEGRMKRPEYVALMTRLYRQAIDSYYAKKQVKINRDVTIEMEKIFNRGFTTGHLYHQLGSALMNPIRPNHMGIKVGVIEQVTKDKMTVRLVEDLAQGDGVRILKQKEDEGFRVNRIYQNGLLVNGAKKGERIQLDKNEYVEKGSILLKTSDVKQLEQLKTTFDRSYRRVGIDGEFIMQIGKPACLKVWDQDGHHIEVFSDMAVEKAMKTPLGKERLQTQLMKTKDTPFDFMQVHLEAVCEDGIMPIKEVNRMRREALEELSAVRSKRYNRRVQRDEAKQLTLTPKAELMLVVHTEAQYQACKKMDGATIYVADERLYKRLKDANEQVYLREPRVQKGNYDQQHVLIQENSGYTCKEGYCTDTSLNITNANSAAFAFQQGASIVTLSLEHTMDRIANLTASFKQTYHQQGNFAVQLYGHTELMLSEYCPIQACLKDDGKKNCGLCRGNTRYDLKDLKGHRYPILADWQCRMHLLSEKPMDVIEDWPLYQQEEITSALIVFTVEDQHQCERVLQKVKEHVYVNSGIAAKPA